MYSSSNPTVNVDGELMMSPIGRRRERALSLSSCSLMDVTVFYSKEIVERFSSVILMSNCYSLSWTSSESGEERSSDIDRRANSCALSSLFLDL